MSSAREFQPTSRGDLCRVLCVDDDPVSQRILVTALARTGFAVECVCSGEEALTRFALDERGFDVLVTDHVMPRMDGAGLVRTLRGLGFDGPVIVVSAALGLECAEYHACGVRAILRKPIDIAVLRAEVAAARDQRRQGSIARAANHGA